MADIAGNPTPTNVPAAQQLSTLVPVAPTVPAGISGPTAPAAAPCETPSAGVRGSRPQPTVPALTPQ